MTDTPTRSPRYPLWDLPEAISKAQKIYDANKAYAAGQDVVAVSIGYKDSNNGAYKKTIACLGYYGLVNVSGGKVSVAKEFVSYLFAPDQKTKNGFLLNWMRGPQIFNALLAKYASDGLPSQQSISYALMNEHGFTPEAADKCTENFLSSYRFLTGVGVIIDSAATDSQTDGEDISESVAPASTSPVNNGGAKPPSALGQTKPSVNIDGESDTIPVRLKGGRKAYLVVPYPFYEADRDQIIRALNTVVTDDESEEMDEKE
ncbi:MAG: hypothetical protein ACK4PK_09850 [Alphaproteobacteria bacterium]